MKTIFLRIVRAISILSTGNDVVPGASLTVQMPSGIECHVHGIEDPAEIFSLPDGSRFNYPIIFPDDLRDAGLGICIDISIATSEEVKEDDILGSEELSFGPKD